MTPKNSGLAETLDYKVHNTEKLNKTLYEIYIQSKKNKELLSCQPRVTVT